jgi:hypothetical protein
LTLEQWFPDCWRAPWRGAVGSLGARVVCMRVMFILNEIWAKDKIYILVGTLLVSNIKLVLFYNLNFTKLYYESTLFVS